MSNLDYCVDNREFESRIHFTEDMKMGQRCGAECCAKMESKKGFVNIHRPLVFLQHGSF